MAKRPTIAAVAELAGVSNSAVSHVFNGRAKVSAATEQRIRKAADDLNWRPSLAGRTVSGVAGHSLGLVITRTGDTFGRDPFFVRLLAGLTRPLSEIGWSLSMTVIGADDEAEVYRQWWAEQRVEGFLLVDLRLDDPRPALLDKLSAPGVVLGVPLDESAIPSVSLSDAVVLPDVLGRLSALGHRRVARVGAGTGLAHTRGRDLDFARACADLGLDAVLLDWHTDSPDPLREILDHPSRVTALIFDSEALATEAISHAQDLDVGVPADISIMAWEDSWVSELVRPRLTALDAPVEESARTAVELIERLSRGEAVESVVLPGRRLVLRESVGPARP